MHTQALHTHTETGKDRGGKQLAQDTKESKLLM